MNSLDRVEIPYGAYWSTPFAKWQGSLQHLHSLRFVAHVAKAELAKRGLRPEIFDFGALGSTVVQFQSFYGAVWPLYEIGLKQVAGPQLSQVCATGQRVLLTGAAEIQLGMANTALLLGADRTSNSPHIYYPAPGGVGGVGEAEDQVGYNFAHDPVGKHPMLQTAENVAKKHGITTAQQHDVVLMRYTQYQDALANDCAFQRRYMTLPFEVSKPNFKGTAAVMKGDEGVFATTAEGLAALKPVMPGGTVTFAGQTHPADGNCGIVLTTPERAQELSADSAVRVRIRAFGQARADLGYMPEAPVPATQRALENAGVALKNIKAIKSHNPFAVNDIVFSRLTGYDLKRMNNYGCSLIWGHSHSATAMRGIIELIEELRLLGGGCGLFQGCAAGDSSMAVVIEVDDRLGR